jgi:hypothetical protein
MHLLPKHAHRARPTLRWPPRPTGVAQSKAPSSRFRIARGLTPPSSRFRLARGLTPPSSGLRLARGLTPPSSGLRLPRGSLTSTPAPARGVQAFNALTRQSRAITRLGITPRRCFANSLGETHPCHCREQCSMAGVSSVTLCHPLPYGQHAAPSKEGRLHPRTLPS